MLEDSDLSSMAASLCSILEDPANEFVSVEVGPYDQAAVLELPREFSVPRTFYLCLRTTSVAPHSHARLERMVKGCGDLRLYMQADGERSSTLLLLCGLVSATARQWRGHARIVFKMTWSYDIETSSRGLSVLLVAIHVASYFCNLPDINLKDRGLPHSGGLCMYDVLTIPR